MTNWPAGGRSPRAKWRPRYANARTVATPAAVAASEPARCAAECASANAQWPLASMATDSAENVEKEMFKKALAQAIASLPERERLVMSLYYKEELNLRETGEVMGVSESRVCQIHSQALIRLKARMADWYS